MAYLGNTPTQQGFIPAIDYFNGNGSTVAFTLSRPVASVAQVQAVIENVPQNPGDAFTVSGNTITFTSAPPSGTNNIYVYYTSPITQVVALPQSPQVFGNLQFSSPGARITGDFSTATIANRTMFQTITSNSATRVHAIPNGTGNISAFSVINNSDPTNASWGQMSVNTSEAAFVSTISGTGSYLPMTFYTGGSERLRVTTTGEVGINTSSPSAQLQVNRTGTGDYTTIRLSNSGASGRTYEIGLGGNTADSNYANKLYFYDSTANALRMAIDSSGRVTMPAQPVFFAGTRNTNSSGANLVFTNVIVNVGSYYSSVTGRFTAPVAGTYSFQWSSLFGTNNTVGRFHLRRNGSDVGGNSDINQLRLDASASGSEIVQGEHSFIVTAAAGDYFNIYFASDDSSTNSTSETYAFFSGYLIG
jgi:hypothetical protein